MPRNRLANLSQAHKFRIRGGYLTRDDEIGDLGEDG